MMMPDDSTLYTNAELRGLARQWLKAMYLEEDHGLLDALHGLLLQARDGKSPEEALPTPEPTESK
jgi:hypothetical protein